MNSPAIPAQAATVRPSSFVDTDRLWQRHAAMAELGGTAAGGVTRLALSTEDIEARVLLRDWARESGFEFAMDDIANVYIRRPGRRNDLPPVMTGSHIDSQPRGGRFDGIYGILAGLEALQAIDAAAIETVRPIEIVGWTNEEGARFEHSLMGSKAYAFPDRLESLLDIKDRDGISVRDEVLRAWQTLGPTPRRALGVVPGAYLEAHIEQGPILEARGKRVGVVTGIQGWRRFVVRIEGEAAHAGTAPQASRKDALMAANRVIGALSHLMADPDDIVRFTVGRFNVLPNSLAVVPSQVEFTIDFRHPDERALVERGDAIAGLLHEHARPCAATLTEISREAPIRFEDDAFAAVREAARGLDHPFMEIYSGAGHDAQNMFKLCPTGMIFVPCERGISHNEAENASPADLAAGAQVLCDALVTLAGR
ncbi:M20 family metallo-hydrolase [Paraburkholderia sp. J63]|uniref:M20 family metallo-hydrolase n=1 Tax=Paraburkholderia sp. J63 TaxID=2805434 RepID=UPI002ABDE07D|nr:M20 family metallo-hydrolase [Paraburkholderia sp. J63]